MPAPRIDRLKRQSRAPWAVLLTNRDAGERGQSAARHVEAVQTPLIIDPNAVSRGRRAGAHKRTTCSPRERDAILDGVSACLEGRSSSAPSAGTQTMFLADMIDARPKARPVLTYRDGTLFNGTGASRT